MATKLQESTQSAKKLGIGCLIFLGIIIVGNFVLGLFKGEEEGTPIFPQTAENAYGDISAYKPKFKSLSLTDGAKREVVLDTIEGTLPDLPHVINVYITKEPHQSLAAQDRAIEIADNLQFTGTPKALSSKVVMWRRGPTTLKINKLLNTIDINTDFRKKKNWAPDEPISVDFNVYINGISSQLEYAGILPPEYINEKSKITYMQLNKRRNLVQADSAAEAQFIRIDFFKTVEAISPITTEGLSEEESSLVQSRIIHSDLITRNPYEGLIHVVTNNTSAQGIVQLSFINWPIVGRSTYKAIPIEKAWQDIQNGEGGSLVSLIESGSSPFEKPKPLNISKFLVTNIEIVYYSAKDYTEYIQPLYKFSGVGLIGDDTDRRADFVFYYPALDYESEKE